MYKLLLCWRYLNTRYLALACIISVMLGVGTLIVVNSVMAGFSAKLRDRLHGLLSDVCVDAMSMDGFPDAEGKMQRVWASPVADKIEAMTPTMEVFAMLQFKYHGEVITRPVKLFGIDPAGHSKTGGFKNYLVNQSESANPPSFKPSPKAMERYERFNQFVPVTVQDIGPIDLSEPPPPDPPPSKVKIPEGIIIGNAIVSYRERVPNPDNPEEVLVKEKYVLEPGDEVILTTVSGQRLAPVFDRLIVTDYFKSEMSEYDANYVFVPLEYLQKMRSMDNRVTSLQIKLKDYRDAPLVTRELRKIFPEGMYMVASWEDKQGALLGAIDVERGLLNVLLFLIIAVAGFGILAIFSMIVVEKTRDIGILKALGASKYGIMQIFIGYGLLLGIVGAIVGTSLGLSLTFKINEFEKWLSEITGRQMFPRDIYYFDKIPTDVQWQTVLYVNLGAIGIAVLFSVLPALRAAMLHPVRALRYE